MINDDFKAYLESELEKITYQNSSIMDISPVSGGSINACYQLKTRFDSFFIKVNNKDAYPYMFQKEIAGLDLIRKSNAFHVPEILKQDTFDNQSYLLMEFIRSKPKTDLFWEDFAERLAKLHQIQNTDFGLDQDNYMGSIEQCNNWHDEWIEFFTFERLKPQVEMALEDRKINVDEADMFEDLYELLEDHFYFYEIPGLVHGDLWSGNFMVNHNGEASIIDPAAYYGFREVDIAMSTLFGGFDQRFYDHYQSIYPMNSGWETRLKILNLYPLLIHVNLFGRSYWTQIEHTLKSVI